jgi:hypothetical protein
MSGRHLVLKIAAPVKQGASHQCKISIVHTGPQFSYNFQQNFAGKKQKLYKIMRMNIFAV